MTETLNLMPVTIRGEIRRVVFVTGEGGYSVFKVAAEDGKEHTVVGPVDSPCEGQFIEVTGHWEKHAEFGQQLRASSYHYSLPSTREGLTRFLGSGAVPGIGMTLAKKIVEHFGDETLHILDHYPKQLMEVPKIGPKKAQTIAKSWQASSLRREIFIFLQGLGISPAYCNRLYKRYGDQTAEAVKKNPYRLAEEVDGIGFLKADEIARELGIPEAAPERIMAAAVYSLNTTIVAGHVGFPEELLLAQMEELVHQPLELLKSGIEHAIARKLLVRRDELIYSPVLAFAELELPRQLKRLAASQRFAGARMRFAPPVPNLNLCDEQVIAVERVAESPLTVITGGPGVGKTTVVGEIVRRAKSCNLKIALAAPTGRAAKRLSETTHMEAKTLHRLLQYDGATGKFVHNETTPLLYDIIIVDEVSMLDILLATSLFRAIRTGSSVLLVGDADQLPSVGPGTVLADLIASGWFLTTHLTRVFRQGKGSSIITNAHSVNRGIMLEPAAERSDALTDFYWIEQEDDQKTLAIMEKLLVERIPERFHFDPVEDVQILTPMNRGSCGTIALNERFRDILNGGNKPQFRYGERRFKLKDKVMQTSNNYEKAVFNGDLGRIHSIQSQNRTFTVAFDDRHIEYQFDEADQLTLAYAITVHKSQGSEFKVVLLPMLPQHYMMLQRNLLYTAMTRAKKLLILIGSAKSIGMAIRNSRQEVRHSRLRQHLIELRQSAQMESPRGL